MGQISKKIIAYTDGGSRSNPGPAGAGVVLKDEKEKIIKTFSRGLGIRTNNEAEYEAVILALEKVKETLRGDIGNVRLEFRMDSELIARQLKGEYKIKEVRLRALAEKAQKMMAGFKTVSFTEIKREKNNEADALANLAMDDQEKTNAA